MAEVEWFEVAPGQSARINHYFRDVNGAIKQATGVLIDLFDNMGDQILDATSCTEADDYLYYYDWTVPDNPRIGTYYVTWYGTYDDQSKVEYTQFRVVPVTRKEFEEAIERPERTVVDDVEVWYGERRSALYGGQRPPEVGRTTKRRYTKQITSGWRDYVRWP